MDNNFTKKQQLFIKEYLIDLNASQAALRAGYSKKTAPFIGAENLKKPKISKEIERAFRERAAKIDVTAEKVFRELALIGFSNMMDYISVQNDGTAYVDLSKLTRDQAASITEVYTETAMEREGDTLVPVRKIKFKTAEKKGALELLGKHLGMFKGVQEGEEEEPKTIRLVIESARRS